MPYFQRLYAIPKLFIWLSIGVAFFIFSVYVVSMAYTVSYEDSGLFGMVCYGAGVAHPPMFPIYSLVCPIFAHLPWISPILGVGLFSAINGVLACFVIALIVFRMTGQLWAGLLASLIYGFSDSFWSQAIIQEVYTLNSLLFFISLWRVIEFSYKPCSRNFHLMVFFSVLGLTNHWPLMVLSAISFPVIIAPVWRQFFRLIGSIEGVKMCGIILATISLYSYPWIRSLFNPYISFYGPIESIKDFWFAISRQGYSGIDNAGGNWIDKQDFLIWLFESMISEQITWFGLFLIPFASLFFIKQKKWFLFLGLILAISGPSILLILLLFFKFNDFTRAIFRVYPLISWGVLSLFVGVGLAQLAQWINQPKIFSYCFPVFFLIPLSLLVLNWDKNLQPKVTWAHQSAMVILESLEKNAILFTHDDTHLPLMYLHYAEKVRPDITIYNTQSLILGSRQTKAILSLEKKRAIYNKLAKKSARPIYTFYQEENPFGSINNGILFQADKNLPKGETRLKIDQPFFDLLLFGSDSFLDNNAWSRNQKNKYAKRLSELLFSLPFDTEGHSEARKTLLTKPYAQLAYASTWFQKKSPISEKKTAFKLLKQVEPIVSNLPPFQQSIYYNTLGRVYSVEASRLNTAEVEKIFLKGLKVYPKNDNYAIYSLLELYAQTKNHDKFKKYSKAFPNSSPGSGIVKAYLAGKEYSPPAKKLSKDEASRKIDLALKYLQQEQTDTKSAMLLVQEVEKVYPNIDSVAFVRGGVHLLNKDFALAVKAFKLALEINPDHSDAQYNLIKIYVATKQWQLIPPILKKEIKKRPKDPLLLKLQAALIK